MDTSRDQSMLALRTEGNNLLVADTRAETLIHHKDALVDFSLFDRELSISLDNRYCSCHFSNPAIDTATLNIRDIHVSRIEAIESYTFHARQLPTLQSSYFFIDLEQLINITTKQFECSIQYHQLLFTTHTGTGAGPDLIHEQQRHNRISNATHNVVIQPISSTPMYDVI